MAGAWIVRQRTGNSGWIDTIRIFSLGLLGAEHKAAVGRGYFRHYPDCPSLDLRVS